MTFTDLVIAVARFANLAGLAVMAGALLFAIVFLPALGVPGNAAPSLRLQQDWHRYSYSALGLGLVSLVLWVPLQIGNLAGSSHVAAIAALLPSALFNTAFGQAALMRLALLLLLLLLTRHALASRRAAIVALCLTLIAIVLQIRMGHAIAAENIIVPLAVGAHIVAALLWFGSLPQLLLLLRQSPDAGRQAAQRFSAYGIVFVLVLVTGGFLAAWYLSGSLAGLIGTFYGNLILIKSTLFLAMFGLASLNRCYFSRTTARHRNLTIAIVMELIIGIGVLLLASLLATQPPAIHGEIIWPFAYRLRDNISGDAFLVNALWQTVWPILSALTVLALAVWLLPKWRLILVPSALIMAALWYQPLRPQLFIQEANPASYLQSPQSFSTITIMRGERAFQTHCASCHAGDGRGRGPLASGNPVWPPDLTTPFFSDRSQGELYWAIRKGKTTDTGQTSMPGFEQKLDAKHLWSLVAYIRILAAARQIGQPAEDGRVYPVRTPQLAASCGNNAYTIGTASELTWLVSLSGNEVKLAGLDPVGNQIACNSDELTAAPAFRLLLGTVTDTYLLIDQSGWLRYRWPADQPLKEAGLSTALQQMRDNPVRAGSSTHHP